VHFCFVSAEESKQREARVPDLQIVPDLRAPQLQKPSGAASLESREWSRDTGLGTL